MINNCKPFLFLLLSIFIFIESNAQTDSIVQKKGKIYGDVFINSNYNFDKNNVSFRLNRLHFGYKYNLTDQFYFNGMIEAALEDYDPIPDTIGDDYSNITNLFEFCLGFKFNKLEGKIGLIGTEFNQQQEKLWQNRYIDKVFADKYGYAPTNDFGLIVIYKPIEWWSADIAITNGEGHKNLQRDSSLRYSIGSTVTIIDKIIVRAYADFLKYPDVSQTNFIGILGFKSKKINAGFEWNQQFNSSGQDGYQKSGISGYANGKISDKFKLFARYDYSASNKPSGLFQDWNISNDGSLIIAGIQYQVISNLKFALDFRTWNPADSNIDTKSFIFFDIEVSF